MPHAPLFCTSLHFFKVLQFIYSFISKEALVHLTLYFGYNLLCLLESLGNVLLGGDSFVCIFSILLFLNLPCCIPRHNDYWGKLTKTRVVLDALFLELTVVLNSPSSPLLLTPPICKLSQPSSCRDLKSVRELSLLIYRAEVCTEESSVMGFFAPWRDITQQSCKLLKKLRRGRGGRECAL